MKAMIIEEGFTATSEQQMRDFAKAYKMCVERGAAIDDAAQREQFARDVNAFFGVHFETAKKCYELMYG
jgi:hypothetical protein